MSDEFSFEAPIFEIGPESGGEAYELQRRAPMPGRRPGGGYRPRPKAGRPRPFPQARRFVPGPVAYGRPQAVFPEPFPVESAASTAPPGSERIRWVQDCLNQALGMQLPVTGVMGPETRSVVRTFQQQKGLRASGIAGPDTEEALKAACVGRSPQGGGATGDPEEQEFGPLRTVVNWLPRPAGVGGKRSYSFSVVEAAGKDGGGVYILEGTKNGQRIILKVGMAPAFRVRFGPTGYGRPTGNPLLAYSDVRAYLGQVAMPKNPLPDIERALARVLYRAGETLPLDDKPPPEGDVRGTVKVTHIVPPGLEDKLKTAYTTTAKTENRRTGKGGLRTITPGTPPNVPPTAKRRQLILEPGNFPKWEVDAGTDSMQGGELFQAESPVMHPNHCTCPMCRRACKATWGRPEFPAFGEIYGETAFESPFSEAEEMELVAELLSVASEEELDLFLGKLVRGAWRGIKKVGKFVGKIAKPLGGVLKGVAKAALPFVGGALGSFIPIPGVGTALGSALGGALSKALEMEFGELTQEEQEFEMARRFVRLAGTAARQAALAPPDADEQEILETAVMDAARRHLPNLPGISGKASGFGGRGRSGRWVRRGNGIVVLGA